MLSGIGVIIQNQGWLAFPLCFLGGLISSTSPCVLAMIPVVIGFVGGYSEGSHKKAVQYSLVFTLGLTITFTLLGIIAGALGRLFGDIGRFWNYLLPAVAILLGVHLLGIIQVNIRIPQWWLPKKKALYGAFLMGLVFGTLATPCATPVLAAILTYAAVQESPVYSGGLLLAYAIGHWALILAAGVSIGFVQRLIDNHGFNSFTTNFKRVCGVILIAVGVYFLVQLFG